MNATVPAAPAIDVVTTRGFGDYALLDSGGGRKLERFGSIIVDRPEPQALWRPRLAEAEWRKAHATFSASGEDDEKGKWRVDKPVPDRRIDLGSGETPFFHAIGHDHAPGRTSDLG